jgi:hypothetical protein
MNTYPIRKSLKVINVGYDIRGPVLEHAKQMEDEGHKIIKLNIGNPATFTFDAPEEIVVDVIRNLGSAAGYGDCCDVQRPFEELPHLLIPLRLDGGIRRKVTVLNHTENWAPFVSGINRRTARGTLELLLVAQTAFLFVAIEGKLDKCFQQLGIGEAGRFAHAREHADIGKPRNGVDLVQKHSPCPTLQKEVNASHTLAADRRIGRLGGAHDLNPGRFIQFCCVDQLRAVGVGVLCLVVVESMAIAWHDFARYIGARAGIADDRAFNLAGVHMTLDQGSTVKLKSGRQGGVHFIRAIHSGGAQRRSC